MSAEGVQTDERRTVTAEVGVGRKDTAEVPEVVGEYDHCEVPNDDTTEWERVHQPREPGEYPYVAVRYAVSCMKLARDAHDEFHISRSVVTCSRQHDVPNLPHADSSGPVHAEEVVANKIIADGIAELTDALTLAVQLMDADSADPSLPPELTDSQREGYRTLEMGEVDGQ
jgi:hypothetical protein